MKKANPDALAKALSEAVHKFVSGKTKFFVVAKAHHKLKKCCGGKLGDDARLTFKDLSKAVEANKGVDQAAQAFLQALGHEFECLQGELTRQPKTEPAKAEPKKTDGKS